MKKLLSKFKVLVPALVCLLALTMVLFTGCKEDVPAHTHSMTHVEGTAATCTTTGVKEHYHCSLCEKDFLTEEGTEEVSAESLILAIDSENHDYVMANTQFAFAKNEQGEWTCTATTECSRNKEHKLVKTATKVEEEVATEATCEEAGSRTLTATFEDKVYGEQGVVIKTEPISALGHNYGSLVAEVPATCTTNGTKEHYTCSVCHKNFDKNHKEIGNITLPAKHDLSYHAKQDPTCTATGNIEYWSCSVCGKNFSNATGTTEAENVTLDMIAHKYTNADGQTNYVYDYENVRYVAACTRCNHQDTTQIKTAGSEQYPYLANDEATLRSAIEKGGYVRLVENVSVSNVISLNPTEHKNTILDLGGNKITGIENSNSSKKLFYINNATFTVRNGHIETPEGWYTFRVNGRKGEDKATKDPNAEIVNTKLILEESLTVTSHGCSVFVWGAGAELVTSATLTNDGEFGTISGNGNTGCDVKSVTILGGQVTHTKEVAIYIPNCKNWNITGGTITGTTAVYIKSGTVVIGKDAKLIATGDKQNYAYNGNGCHSTGEALVIDACGYPGGNPTVTIENGATFETKDATDKAKEIGVYHYNGNTATVTNGTSYNADAVVVNP